MLATWPQNMHFINTPVNSTPVSAIVSMIFAQLSHTCFGGIGAKWYKSSQFLSLLNCTGLDRTNPAEEEHFYASLFPTPFFECSHQGSVSTLMNTVLA